MLAAMRHCGVSCTINMPSNVNPNSMFGAQKKLFANLFANKRFVKSMYKMEF